MMARTSATSPITCGPSVELPAADAVVVLATGRVTPVPDAPDAAGEIGLTEGNSPPASLVGVSPGLSAGVGAPSPTPMPAPTPVPVLTPGTDCAGCVVVVVLPAGLGGATMLIAPDAAGPVARPAALTEAVRVTDETVVAVSGTVTCAWNCRTAEFESTVPRAHDEVPSPPAHPTLNVGVPVPAGVVASWSVALVTEPPVVQAATAHFAAFPRATLCCEGSTATHRLVCAVAMNAVSTAALSVDVAVAAPDEVDGVEVTGSGVVGATVGGSVVGVSVAGVGVGVVAAGVGVAVVGAGAAVVAGGGADVAGLVVPVDGTGSVSHHPAPTVEAAVAADAVPAAAVRTPHQAAVSRRDPANAVVTVRRARSKRM